MDTQEKIRENRARRAVARRATGWPKRAAATGPPTTTGHGRSPIPQPAPWCTPPPAWPISRHGLTGAPGERAAGTRRWQRVLRPCTPRVRGCHRTSPRRRHRPPYAPQGQRAHHL